MDRPNIPVKNLWLLMLYASDLAFVDDKVFVAAEENPEGLPDLVAALLCEAAESSLRKGLTLGFRNVSGPLRRVRGKINFLVTDSKQLLSKGLVHCYYDQVSPDTDQNRFVLAALKKCLLLLQDETVASRCRRCIHWMRSIGVSDLPVTSSLDLGKTKDRRTARDRTMLSLARLAMEMKLPSEQGGDHLSYEPSRDERWLRDLFEKAVAGFYSIYANSAGWKTTAGKWLSWQIDEQSALISDLLPKMKTDIFLESPKEGRRIIIDTKFNEIVVKGRYRDRSFRSGYVYQMYAYTMSQLDSSDFALSTEGILLHPAFGESYDESVTIQGNHYRFMTIDLVEDLAKWKDQLLKIFKPRVSQASA